MSSEIEVEAIPGLPGELPPGEYVIWQGRPQWKAFARETFSLRWLAGYFALFTALRFVASLGERSGLGVMLDVLAAAGLALACLGIFTFMAWLNARSAIYTITTRRVVLRIGVALPMTWNLPFKRLAAADLKVRKSGDGDIMLRLTPPNRIAWLHLWPHVAPWQLVKARPTLRAIAEPARVAKMLAEAVQSWAAAEATPVVVGHESPSTAPHETEHDGKRVPLLVAEVGP